MTFVNRRRRRRLLETLGRFRRPFAWTVMLTGLVGFVATFPLALTVGPGSEGFWVTLAGFFLLFLDGYDKVIEVEFTDDGEVLDP